MSERPRKWLPLAILPITENRRSEADLPIAYIPKGEPVWTRRPTLESTRRGCSR